MKKYIKTFSEFVNESFENVSTAKAKVDELWSESGDNNGKFEKLCRDYLQDNLDVEGFLSYFSENLLDKISESLDSANIDNSYGEQEEDEDGNVIETGNLNDLNDFVYDMEDDETYGEFGLSLNKADDDITIYAFCGELDITDTKLGECMINSFNELYDVAMEALKNNKRAEVRDAEDLKATYRSLAQSNGWAY